jgi:hypothetical protein
MKLEPHSRYAQHLSDALEKEFEHSRYEHRIFEKYQISVPDKEYFEYWDIFVWLYDKSTSHGCGRLIEVYNPSVDIYADYREFRQPKVLATKEHFKKYTDVIPVRFLSYDVCAGEGLEKTAKEIFKEMSQQLHRNISRNFGPTKIPDWVKS